MLAFALRADGWYLRQDIIWHKPNPMPESVRDRCTKSHEYIFLFSKSPRYYFDSKAIKEPANEKYASRYKSAFNAGAKERAGCGRINNAANTAGMKTYTGFRNKRDVWTVTTKPFKGAHFATFPDTLITPCVLAGSRIGGTVLDPFCGSGTTLMVANEHGRNGIGIELNEEYEQMIKERIGEFDRMVVEEGDQ
jgi:DNA modification methylase